MRNFRRDNENNDYAPGNTYGSNGIVDKNTGAPACPLQSVEINAVLDTRTAEVTLTQYYINTSNHALEALYTFPVPHDAQVTGFKCRVGSDEVTGEFREKEEAFMEYDKAVRKGDSAFLLESHRPDIFQVSLGNIAAGETAAIVISYLEDVGIADRELRWSIPTVVAPRYIPGNNAGHKTGPGTAHPTDQVPDADYITPPVGNPAYTLKIKVVLKGINGLKRVSSPSHPVDVGFSNGDVTVELARENEPLDSDFIISAELGQDNRDSYITAEGSNGVFGSVSFHPELSSYFRKPEPCEYVFLIDVSGSMGGEKLEQAKRALSISLRNLFEEDYFNIVAFESSYRSFSNETVPYSQQTLESADKWVASLTEMGGTEIYEPLRFVLEKPQGVKGLERVVFLFTDGQVGNENQIISLVEQNRMSLQLYPFGIDTAVNRYFIDSLARSGNGMPEYIYPGERIEDKVIRQFSRVQQPYIANISVSDREGRQLETVPSLPSRLYDSEGLNFTFRSEAGGIPDKIKIRGNIGDKCLEFEMEGEETGDDRLLGLKWARDRITELESLMNGSYERRNDLIRKEVTELSIKYSVLSTLTSLVAVYNRKTKTAGMPQTVVVPVAAPRGWTMPLVSDKTYSFAPMCVTEACMRSYADQSEGFDRMSGMPNEAESAMAPSFRKKGRTVSGRSGLSKLLRKHAEQPVCSNVPETLGRGQGSDPKLMKSADNEKNLYEMILAAAQLQNAAGSFGSCDEGILPTSCFIIGMLLSEEEWKPYRLQLIKAGEALMRALTSHGRNVTGAVTTAINAARTEGSTKPENPQESTSLSLAAAALAMLADSGLLMRETKTSNVSGLFNGVLSGNLDQLQYPDGRIPETGTDKKSRAVQYLQAVIEFAATS